MINCKDVMKEISDYLDGELAEDVRQQLRGHLKKCHDCQVIVDTTRRTIELYCDGELFPLPDAVRDRLHEALRRKCQGQSK